MERRQLKEKHRIQLRCQELAQQIRVSNVRHQFDNSSGRVEARIIEALCGDFSIDYDPSSVREERRWSMEGLSTAPVGMTRAEANQEGGGIFDRPPFSTSPPPVDFPPSPTSSTCCSDSGEDDDYVEIIGETERTIDGIRYIIVLE